MADLDTLRPEVREAMDEMDRIARIVPAQSNAGNQRIETLADKATKHEVYPRTPDALH